MRLSLRFILPLGIALAAIAYAVVPLVDRLTLQWFVRDLNMRAALITNATQESLAGLVRDAAGQKKLTRFLDHIVTDERVYAVGLCASDGTRLYATRAFPKSIECNSLVLHDDKQWLMQLPTGPVHLSVNPIEWEGEGVGELIILHDMSFVQRRSADTKKYVFYLFAAIAAVVALITVVIAEVSWRGWVAGIKALISGEALLRAPGAVRPDAPRSLRPIARDLRALVQDLEAQRRSRDESQTAWGPDALRRILREDLKGDEVLIVSNREPYIHVRRSGKVIEVQRPASGLVTALEPVMRACSGTWIAHGAGSADRETVDRRDHVMVPPDKPFYRIRRVWLTEREERGYYYGFANEGLWPLCHIAHTRPVFRNEDWQEYQRVNRRFADVVAEEARTPDPIVLVQDYHFALLPRMVRERLPQATLITFWHIPWPNFESFGILPWREAVLEGLLGSSILGFHTQSHCNNFFDTVDRFLEARVDRESFSVSYGGELTEVRRYPISIEWPPMALRTQNDVPTCRANVRQRLGLPPDIRLGVGVDRLDYTKGILERFRAVERLLELEPRWIGRFAFLQIAAPSRSSIDEYRNLHVKVHELADAINARFGLPGYKPIILLAEHHDVDRVYELYRAADLCYVSSLHDGMNLVAKEFIAARDDDQGVLILSQFAGAARELAEALIVNPYDIDHAAAALRLALSMDAAEQRVRMRSMRSLVQEFNVYRWAGRMLMDAARMRHRRRVLSRTRSVSARIAGR